MSGRPTTERFDDDKLSADLSDGPNGGLLLRLEANAALKRREPSLAAQRFAPLPGCLATDVEPDKHLKLMHALRSQSPRCVADEMTQSLLLVDHLMAHLGSLGNELAALLVTEQLAYHNPKAPNYFREHVAHAIRVLWVGERLLRTNRIWEDGLAAPAVTCLKSANGSFFKFVDGLRRRDLLDAFKEGLSDPPKLLWRAWILAALWHDMAYTLEFRHAVDERLRRAYGFLATEATLEAVVTERIKGTWLDRSLHDQFKKSFPVSPESMKQEKAGTEYGEDRSDQCREVQQQQIRAAFATLLSKNHAYGSAVLLLDWHDRALAPRLSPSERPCWWLAAQLAAEAIVYHHADEWERSGLLRIKKKEPVLMFTGCPLATVLFLADHLQEFGRIQLQSARPMDACGNELRQNAVRAVQAVEIWRSNGGNKASVRYQATEQYVSARTKRNHHRWMQVLGEIHGIRLADKAKYVSIRS